MKPIKHNAGFTLVELMVVMVILGIIVVGVLGMVITQNRAYHTEEAIIDMQMNANVAMDRISRIIRMSGFGCKDSFGSDLASGNLATHDDANDAEDAANPVTALFNITDHDVAAAGQTRTPDILTVVAAYRYVGTVTGDGSGGTLAVNNPVLSLTLNSIGNLTDNTVENGEKAYIYLLPSIDETFHTITAIAGNVITLADSVTAQVDDEVFQVQAYTIRLKDGNLRLDENIDPSTASLDVAENIEELQFQYGVDTDTDTDKCLDSWTDAPADISRIRAVRVFILARTAHETKADEYTNTSVYRIAGTDVGPFNDHFHRYLLETTVYLRNLGR
jgi:prepilin-type N-terminal cleavage/methylation domain-containing protein